MAGTFPVHRLALGIDFKLCKDLVTTTWVKLHCFELSILYVLAMVERFVRTGLINRNIVH